MVLKLANQTAEILYRISSKCYNCKFVLRRRLITKTTYYYYTIQEDDLFDSVIGFDPVSLDGSMHL